MPRINLKCTLTYSRFQCNLLLYFLFSLSSSRFSLCDFPVRVLMSKWPALLSFLSFDSEAVLFWSYLPFNCFVTFVFRVMSKLLWWCLARVMKPQWVFTPGLKQEFENANSCIQLGLLSPVWINDHWKWNISKCTSKWANFTSMASPFHDRGRKTFVSLILKPLRSNVSCVIGGS